MPSSSWRRRLASRLAGGRGRAARALRGDGWRPGILWVVGWLLLSAAAARHFDPTTVWLLSLGLLALADGGILPAIVTLWLGYRMLHEEGKSR